MSLLPSRKRMSFILVLWMLNAILLCATKAAGGNVPFLVKELSNQNDSSYPRLAQVLGDTVLFYATDSVHGTELWKSNGAADGTSLLKDISHGGNPYDVVLTNRPVDYIPPNPPPLEASRIGHSYFFTADDGTHGSELWVTDGTSGGTRMVKDINPGPDDSVNTVELPSATLNGKIYFAASDGRHGTELWKSDGTAAGTVMVKDIAPGKNSSSPFNLISVGNAVYFSVTLNNDRELWKTDGTESGTVKVASAYFNQMCAAGANLYYTTGDQLWKCNTGTTGTQLIKDFRPSSGRIYNMAVLGGKLYFAVAVGTHSQQLWRSDGTASGTYMVKDINPANQVRQSDSVFFRSPVALNGKIYFMAQNYSNYQAELWSCDGTASGTFKVKAFSAGKTCLAAGGRIYLAADDGSHGSEPWISDGTGAGTKMLKDIAPGWSIDSNPYSFMVNSKGTVFFSANDGKHGAELWKTNGTADGTVMVKDIEKGGKINIWNMIAFGSKLYFSAADSISWPVLYKTDGTNSGTNSFEQFIDPEYMTVFNGSLYFLEDYNNLYKCNGTTITQTGINQQSFGSLSTGIRNLGAALYFTTYSSNESAHYKLWKSNGTPAGTTLIKQGQDIARDMMNAGGSVYFTLMDYISRSVGIWKTNGTTAGTKLIKSFQTANMTMLAGALNSMLYFYVEDQTHGLELWKTDGSAAGTVLVKIIHPSGAAALMAVSGGAAVNNLLLFCADDGVHGLELWRTDGTGAGTFMLRDINPGTAGSNIRNMIVVNGILFFTAYDPDHGIELWKSNGTAAGTVRVKDINPGKESSNPSWLCNVNGKLYFSAYEPDHGVELWKSDGTENGTVLAADIHPGSDSSTPGYLTKAGNYLYFRAVGSSSQGRELWALKVQ